MTLKSGTYRVGTQTFIINRSKMSSSALRQVEAQYNQARAASAREAAARRRQADIVRKAALQKRLDAEQRNYEKRLRLGKIQVERGSTPKRTGAGGVSSTFQESIRQSRLSASERAVLRKQDLASRRAMQKERNEIRRLERESAAKFPSYSQRDTDKALATIKQVQRSKTGMVATSLGPSAFRLLPVEGGGPVRALHARSKIEFGGAMGDQLTPKAARKLGTERIFQRSGRIERELRASRGQTPSPKIKTQKPQTVYEVANIRVGTTQTFKTEAAATGFATRQSEAEYNRELRKAGISQRDVLTSQKQTKREEELFRTAPTYTINKLLKEEKSRPPKMETVTITERTDARIKPVDFEFKGLGVDLPYIGRIEEPFITGGLRRATEEAKQVIGSRRAALSIAETPSERAEILARSKKQLKNVERVTLDVTKETGNRGGLLTRLNNLDLIPGYDVTPSPAAQSAIGVTIAAGVAIPAAAAGGIYSGGAALGKIAASFIVGGKVAEKTKSPLLGLLATGGTNYALGKIGKLPSPKMPKIRSIKLAPKKLSLKVQKLGTGIDAKLNDLLVKPIRPLGKVKISKTPIPREGIPFGVKIPKYRSELITTPGRKTTLFESAKIGKSGYEKTQVFQKISKYSELKKIGVQKTTPILGKKGLEFSTKRFTTGGKKISQPIERITITTQKPYLSLPGDKIGKQRIGKGSFEPTWKLPVSKEKLFTKTSVSLKKYKQLRVSGKVFKERKLRFGEDLYKTFGKKLFKSKKGQLLLEKPRLKPSTIAFAKRTGKAFTKIPYKNILKTTSKTFKIGGYTPYLSLAQPILATKYKPPTTKYITRMKTITTPKKIQIPDLIQIPKQIQTPISRRKIDVIPKQKQIPQQINPPKTPLKTPMRIITPIRTPATRQPQRSTYNLFFPTPTRTKSAPRYVPPLNIESMNLGFGGYSSGQKKYQKAYVASGEEALRAFLPTKTKKKGKKLKIL